MLETPQFLMATFLALPIFVGALPFVVMEKLDLPQILKWLGVSSLAVVASSLLAALLTNCSFQEVLLLLRETFECRPISMLRAVFVSYVFLFAGAATFPFVAAARALRCLKRPNPAVKRDAPQAARPLIRR